MLTLIYIKNKKKKIILYKNSIELPILINKHATIYLYNHIKYIKLKKFYLFKNYFKNIESYSLNYKINKYFNLINTYFPKLYIKDTLSHKNLLIKYNFSFLNYYFYKNIILNKNILLLSTHREFTNYSNFSIFNNKSITLNLLNIFKLHKEYIFLNLYYTYWKNLFKNKYIINLLNGFSLYKFNSISTIKDITSSLISIETIFETRTFINKYLIPTNLSILNNLFVSFEDTTSNYIWIYNLYSLNTKNLLLFTEINTITKKIYENKTAILLPNNIITSGNYSINNLIFKLYSHNLNYYVQDQAIKISHIFIFNLIVESLLKQYFKNGIIIPSIQFEIIVKKMTSFVKLNNIGDSSLLENDILDFNKLEILNYTFYILGYKQLSYIPIILGITKSILASSGFLASISFQEIIKFLIKLSIENTTDWLTDLKSKIITTDLIKTGSGWYRHFIKI